MEEKVIKVKLLSDEEMDALSVILTQGNKDMYMDNVYEEAQIYMSLCTSPKLNNINLVISISHDDNDYDTGYSGISFNALISKNKDDFKEDLIRAINGFKEWLKADKAKSFLTKYSIKLEVK